MKIMKCDVVAIWDAHKKYMESFIRRRVKDEELAKDLLQEVLLKMCEFCRKSNDVKNVKNWLFSITRNVMVDHFRKERKKEEMSTISVHTVLTEDNLNEIASAFILPMIDQLPEKYRIPLMWSDIEQIPQTEIARNLIPYVAIGIGIGSFIHGYVPEEFIQKYVAGSDGFSVPLAVILAVPLYIDAIGVLPVIETLIAKGVPLGTAVAFMMGAIGLSLPEALLLKKVMQVRLLVIYFGTTAVCMMLAGYFFNVIF